MPRKDVVKRSIFRALFIPLIILMIIQSASIYIVAVYGGIEKLLTQTATDILSQKLITRKNELELSFNGNWSALDGCRSAIDEIYAEYEVSYGRTPLISDTHRQISFLSDSSDALIDTLRQNEVNGIFLIINDSAWQSGAQLSETEQKYGLGIRDMDQHSNYSGRSDLLLERAPASIVDSLGVTLDSWWEAKYTFDSKSEGDYFYYPLDAAWENRNTDGKNLAYISDAHNISEFDRSVISYSIPLVDETGYPYAVLGIELTTDYLASIMPNRELNNADRSSYVLAIKSGDDGYRPIVGTGALYSRCFYPNQNLHIDKSTAGSEMELCGRDGTELYCDITKLEVYNNNNPFEDNELVLIALVESSAMFEFIKQVKISLLLVSLFSLILGTVGILSLSQRFAAPITALSKKVREMKPQSDFELEHLGISEIDQLVDAIDELNRNVSKNNARTEFFSRMSHDMRTPMNAIISFSSPEMLEDASSAVKDDYLAKIHDSGRYLLQLINEVLDMTKIESNKIELHVKTVRAAALFNVTIPMIEKLAQQKQINFVVDIAIPTGDYVLADEQYISQIIMNLLSNAVKFTPNGGRVSMSAAMNENPDDPECSLCKITVSDTGIGMSEEFMRGLYSPFEQENNNREGSGLGLSIAKKLVELMNGTIDCASEKHVGTTFTVILPLTKASEKLAELEKEPLRNADLSLLKGKKILVCEDNAMNMQIITHLLGKAGMAVVQAFDGKQGVEQFENSSIEEFDAVLLDIRMPVMNGLETSRAIRSLRRSDAARVPIIAMTANAFEADVRASKEAGMNAHLAKPIEPRLLYETLRYQLGEIEK